VNEKEVNKTVIGGQAPEGLGEDVSLKQQGGGGVTILTRGGLVYQETLPFEKKKRDGPSRTRLVDTRGKQGGASGGVGQRMERILWYKNNPGRSHSSKRNVLGVVGRSS